MTKKLKPEDAVKPEHEFLTVIGDRSPERKSHATLGQAKGAASWRISGNSGAPTEAPIAIFERNASGDWTLLYDIPTGTDEAPWNREQ